MHFSMCSDSHNLKQLKKTHIYIWNFHKCYALIHLSAYNIIWIILGVCRPACLSVCLSVWAAKVLCLSSSSKLNFKYDLILFAHYALPLKLFNTAIRICFPFSVFAFKYKQTHEHFISLFFLLGLIIPIYKYFRYFAQFFSLLVVKWFCLFMYSLRVNLCGIPHKPCNLSHLNFIKMVRRPNTLLYNEANRIEWIFWINTRVYFVQT